MLLSFQLHKDLSQRLEPLIVIDARAASVAQQSVGVNEAVQTTHIHRVAGLTGDRMAWVPTHPLRACHTISDAGLIGGGHGLMPSGGMNPYFSV
jgi:hypothetical protein